MRYGHSKDKRPDLLQYRQLLGTLDPAGIPLVSATLAGNGADDPLYWPTWQRMAQVIGHNSFVFLADCKAAAIATRAQIAAKGGIYCFPVPMSGLHPLLLKQWVLDPPTPSVDIRLRGKMRMTLRSGEALRWSWANSGSTQPPKRGCGGMSVIWLFTRPAWRVLTF